MNGATRRLPGGYSYWWALLFVALMVAAPSVAEIMLEVGDFHPTCECKFVAWQTAIEVLR